MPPVLVHDPLVVRQAVAQARRAGRTIGLVPTMGALHEGHVSLIRQARAEAGYVAVSIFVNPAQFGPKEDLARYPRPLENDLALCAAAGVDLVFQPDAGAMYPPGFDTYVEVRDLQDVMCGASRPGHFRGVATVVLKLFNIVQPDWAYFGQKDAQQARLIEKMVRDLDVPVAIKVCPIVRAADGLALSSRNVYLNAQERAEATVLFKALQEVERQVGHGERDAQVLIQAARAIIGQASRARVDYVTIVALETLRPKAQLKGLMLVALAVFFGGTRLIDNVILEVNDS